MMKIEFHTKNLDQTFYRQMIMQYIADHISQNFIAYNKYQTFHNDWTINIYPVEDWDGEDGRSRDTGTTNPGIPHGVTGDGIIKIYVIDDSDRGLMSIQNFSTIFHEVAHMLLIIIIRGKRGVFRNDDLSGNKKGSQANVSTQEVHDRQMEGKLYQVKAHINVGSWFKRKWQSYTAVGIDLRDFLQHNL